MIRENVRGLLLLIAAIIIFAALMFTFGESEELRTLLIFAFYFAVSLIYSLDSRYPVVAAILLLISAAIFLPKDEAFANRLAIYAYYFLVVGVGLQIIEYIKEQREDEEEREKEPDKIMNGKTVVVLIVAGIIALSALYAYSESSKAPVVPEQTPKPIKAKTISKPTPEPKPKENRFGIEIVDVKERGALSRVVTARLVNRDGYAKNVEVTLELFLDGNRVRVNGKDALTIVIGDMDAKSVTQKEVEISVGLFDGLKIKNKGYVDAKLTVSWNGGREVFKKRILFDL